MAEVRFELLAESDLQVGATYLWGREPNLKAEPLNRLLGVGNVGGFRWRGQMEQAPFVVITSNNKNAQWPDSFDRDTGSLTYFGDNRIGHDLTATKGNKLLGYVQQLLLRKDRAKIPPFLYFTKSTNPKGWVFEGVFYPSYGDPWINDWPEIVIGGKAKQFANYRAAFQRTEDQLISRSALQAGSNLGLSLDGFRHWILGQRRIL